MRKALVTCLILLVVLGGVFVAGDIIGRRVAQNEIAKNVRAQYTLDHTPKVSIKGFPFLTQALDGRYDEIDVNVGELTEQGVRLTDTTVALKGVTAPMSDAMHGDASKMVADTATSTATIGYDDVNKQAPNHMKVSAKGSDLQVRGPYTVLGVTQTVTATVTVQPSGRSIRVVPQTVKAGGMAVPVGLVRQAFTFTMPVKGLPLGTRISDVQVKPEGLRVSTTAQNVKLSSLNVH
ncbi:LmeA family phospholipid-binding protein [Actinoallomurus sp. CA-150999]|uniref:LmeA family phospholipid-binding protein n=1 Tax=Actinoallomurus sp. CA-150999 TaxID=3239887 RepID=UPI003D89B540